MKKQTTELLKDSYQILSDLQNIYYWYACGKLNEALFADSSAAPLGRGGSASCDHASAKRRKLEMREPRMAAGLLASDSCSEPLVEIEVELTTPNPAKSMQPTSLSKFCEKGYLPPFERALDCILAQHGRKHPAPLNKVFYLVYREEVTEPSGSKSFRIRWSAAVMMCYCPFKQGKETLQEVNECFPAEGKLIGYGDGCTYWHGKLVPGTRVGKLSWLEDGSIIEAVLQASSTRGHGKSKQLQHDKKTLETSMGRVVTRWFFNSRTLISDDKYELTSFKPEHLQLRDTRRAADRATATDKNESQRLLEETDLQNKGLKNVPGKNSLLIVSDRPVRLQHCTPPCSSQSACPSRSCPSPRKSVAFRPDESRSCSSSRMCPTWRWASLPSPAVASN